MPRRSAMPALAGLAFLLAAPAAAQTDDLEWSGRVEPDGWIKVFSGNGRIDAMPAAGDLIEVVGERGAHYRDRDPVRFEVRRVGADVVICAVTEYTECRDDGLRTTERRRSHNPEPVHFTVRLPRGTHARLSTGNGELRIEGVGGDIVARSGNGDVQVLGTSGTVEVSSGNGDLDVGRATGPVRASTGNGRVTVRTSRGPVYAHSGNGEILVDMASIQGEGDLEFHTGSGDIELRLPADLDAELVTRLGNGDLTSDFPLLVEGRTSFRNLRATIGAGGRRLTVASGNGDAVLRRR